MRQQHKNNKLKKIVLKLNDKFELPEVLIQCQIFKIISSNP